MAARLQEGVDSTKHFNALCRHCLHVLFIITSGLLSNQDALISRARSGTTSSKSSFRPFQYCPVRSNSTVRSCNAVILLAKFTSEITCIKKKAVSGFLNYGSAFRLRSPCINQPILPSNRWCISIPKGPVARTTRPFGKASRCGKKM